VLSLEVTLSHISA